MRYTGYDLNEAECARIAIEQMLGRVWMDEHDPLRMRPLHELVREVFKAGQNFAVKGRYSGRSG